MIPVVLMSLGFFPFPQRRPFQTRGIKTPLKLNCLLKVLRILLSAHFLSECFRLFPHLFWRLIQLLPWRIRLASSNSRPVDLCGDRLPVTPTGVTARDCGDEITAERVAYKRHGIVAVQVQSFGSLLESLRKDDHKSKDAVARGRQPRVTQIDHLREASEIMDASKSNFWWERIIQHENLRSSSCNDVNARSAELTSTKENLLFIHVGQTENSCASRRNINRI